MEDKKRYNEPVIMTPEALNKSLTGRQSDETAEQTKQAIIREAKAEFAKYGFEGTSMRNVAKRAGVSNGLIRHHFGAKEGVFYAVVDHVIESFSEQREEIISQLKPVDFSKKETLISVHKNLLRGFAWAAAQNPDMVRILLHEGIQNSERLQYIFERVDQINTMHGHFFEALQNFGVLPHLNKNQVFLFMLMNLGVVFGLTKVSSHYSDGDILSKNKIEEHSESIINMLYASEKA